MHQILLVKKIEIVKEMPQPVLCIDINARSDIKSKNYVKFI